MLSNLNLHFVGECGLSIGLVLWIYCITAFVGMPCQSFHATLTSFINDITKFPLNTGSVWTRHSIVFEVTFISHLSSSSMKEYSLNC